MRLDPPSESRVISTIEIRPLHATAIYFALAVIYFAKALVPDRLIFGTDYLASGYVFNDFAARQLAAGELPSWVPHVFGGVPFFANPGSTFYPMHLLAAQVLPMAKVLPVLLILQLTAAGFGMYLLAREIGARSWVAFVSGISYQFTGVVLSWVYAGHDGRIIVATLAPLVLALLHRGLRSGELAAFAGTTAALGCALLSFQIQTAWYLLLSALVLGTFVLYRLRRELTRRDLARRGLYALGAVAFAFALAAINFLPFAGFVESSPRSAAAGRGYAYSTTYSATFADLVGLAVPEQVGSSVTDPATDEPMFPPYRGPNGFKLHTEYVGVLALLLLVLGVRVARGDAYFRLFLGLGAFALTLTLGGNTPLYRVYYALLPGLDRFRAPDLAFYVVALSLNAMAAIALEHLARERDHSPTPARHGVRPLIVVGVALVLIALGGALWAQAQPIAKPDGTHVSAAFGFVRFAAFIAATTAILATWFVRKLPLRGAIVALCLLVTLDTWIIGRRFLFLAPPEQTFVTDDIVTFLTQHDPSSSRTFALPVPAPYRGGGAYLMHFNVDQVAGEHSTPLQRYLELLGTSPRQRVDWHNLILRADLLEGDDPNQTLGLELRRPLLDALAAKWIVSKLPLLSPGLREVFRGTDAIVYENTTAMQRAYLVPNVALVDSPQASLRGVLSQSFDPAGIAYVEASSAFGIDGSAKHGSVELVERHATRTVVKTDSDGPALLVLAENFYAGWSASIDGSAATLVVANHTLQAVPVSAGAHTVVFEFRPAALRTGLWISLSATVLLSALAFWLVRRSRARP